MSQFKDRFNSYTPFMQVIVLLLVGGVSFFVISSLATLIVQAFNDHIPIDNMQLMATTYPVSFMLIFFMPFQLGFLLVPGLIYFYVLNPSPVRTILFKFSNYFWAIAVFVAVFFLLPFFSTINDFITQSFGVYDVLMEQKTQSDQQLIQLFGSESSSTAFLVGLLLVGLLTGIAEEYFFRGFLFKHMLKFTQKKWLSIVVSGLVFALLHFNYVQFIPLLIFGIILTIMYYVSGSLLPGIIAHVANNALNVFWLHTDNFPAWMETMWVEITIPSTILLMGLIYYKKSVLS